MMATNEFHIPTKTGTGVGKNCFPGKSIFTKMEPKMLSLKWILSKCDQFVPVLNTKESFILIKLYIKFVLIKTNRS